MRKENQKMFYLDDKECVSTLDLYISTADTDRTYDATLPFFFASCQEIAGLHATEKGMGLKSMTEEEQKTWMITREKIKFNYWPHWGETIKMRSWPQKGFHLVCPRVIEAETEDGRSVFSSMSHWVVLDLARKRPVRPKEIEERLPVPSEDRHYIDPDIGKMRKYEEEEKLELFPVYYPSPCFFDVDYNRHINNVVYTRWIISALPDDFLLAHRIKEIDVQWVSQTFEHDKIYVESAITERKDDEVRISQRIMRENEDESITLLFESSSLWIGK